MPKIAIISPEMREWSPINMTRPIFEIKCGMFSFMERIEELLGDRDTDMLIVPEILEGVTRGRFSAHTVNPKFLEKGDIVLWGDVVFDRELLDDILGCREGALYTSAGRNIALVAHDTIPVSDISNVQLPRNEVQALIPSGIWDIPLLNGEQLIKDFESIRHLPTLGFVPLIGSGESTSRIEMREPSNVFISTGVDIEPFVFLDASDGPVILGENVMIKSGAVIRGPFFADRGTVIYSAKISGGTTLGPVCRVGGEVEASVVHGYSNKHHDGFLGHSYLGEWVNLGALTTNSDLKNNYGNIRYPISVDEVIDTGRMKVGAFLGDHTKTGIGTLLNSGTNIGVACNVWGGGLAPKYLDSFKWGSDEFVEYKWDKARDTMLRVTARRGVTPCKAEIDLLEKISRDLLK